MNMGYGQLKRETTAEKIVIHFARGCVKATWLGGTKKAIEARAVQLKGEKCGVCKNAGRKIVVTKRGMS